MAADKALAARRVEEVLRIRLDGAEFWDVRDFVREKEAEAGSAWHLAEDASPLSDSQIRRYQQRADALMMKAHERSRRKLFRRHLAQRRNLYARAVTTGEISTALAVLKDEATLLSLYERPVARPPAGANKSRAERLAESVAFYEAIVASSAPLAERMRAQERIDRLLGLEMLDIDERLRALEEAVCGQQDQDQPSP
jgi:hypothetical protein